MIVILPVVLYGCEISSLTLREKYRLKVCRDRLLVENILTEERGNKRRLEKTA
jgi:hypothetical protein